MVLTYYGDTCFRVQSGELSLLADPLNARLKSNFVLRTLTPTKLFGETQGVIAAGEIVSPGEYELHGIDITGFPVAGESTPAFFKTVYLVGWEEVRCAFLGHLSGQLDPGILEQLENVDVLFLPVSDSHFLAPEAAAKLVKQIEPALVVPSVSDNAKEFLKAMGQKSEPQEKFVFKKKELESGKSRVVVLSSSK